MQVASPLPMGSPQRVLRHGMSPSPSRMTLVDWASPRAGSPSAIISEAKEFVASESPWRERLQRKPSLDANQGPFGDSDGATHMPSSSPLTVGGGGGPRRLPSLTMEAFRAIKTRDGLQSRCSDPGSQAPLHERRSSSRRDKKSRRRHAERGGSGTSSAPASRGDQVAEIITPLHVPEPPMTEPYTDARCHVSLTRSQMSCEPSSTVNAAGSTSTPSSVASRRPPQVPNVSSTSSKSRPRGCTGYAEGLPLEASPSAVPSRSPSPGLCGLARSPTPGEASPSSVPSRSPSPGLCGLARSPTPGEGELSLPPGPRLETTPQRHRGLHEELAQRSPLGGGKVLRPRNEAEVTLAECCEKGGTQQNPASTAATTAGAASEVSRLSIPVQDCPGWDASESLDQSKASSSRSRVVPNLNVSRGPHGITDISLAATGGLVASVDSFCTPRPQDGLNSSCMGTLSSPDAIRGARGITWVKGQVLGHGTLGTVFEGLDQRTGQIFAVKEVRIDRKNNADVKLKTDIENEICIYKDLSHPHIVQYLGHDYMSDHLYIYLEYMPGGSVAQVLSQFGPFSEELLQRYAHELLEGLDYLHTRTPLILHRDIKGANILVGDGKVKLADFGCSKRTADTLASSMRGSIPWMAPEVIQQSGHGRRSDVWSFGCVCIEMSTAKHPWGHFDNPMAAMMRIGMSQEVPPVPEHLSEPCRDFIRNCVQRDKNLRPLASTLLQHEFVRDVKDFSISEHD
eukprot:TRINITY_DN8379_c0_g2_i3.p1 TRINITY_DN8379_c0_g2~~TRINITY_DN8379_c0_g2_i3.p1  ORF type:complete len:780 (-),score=122.75 TRINITY_DN8379_c0_g2_i3:90-2306(-)